MTYFHSTLLHNHIHCTCMVDSSIVESTLISYNLFYWSNSVLLGEQLYKYCTTPLMCLFFSGKKGIEFYSSTFNAFRMNNSEICRLSLGNDSKMWGGCGISMIEKHLLDHHGCGPLLSYSQVMFTTSFKRNLQICTQKTIL